MSSPSKEEVAKLRSQRLAEEEEEQRRDGDVWAYCCHLSEKEKKLSDKCEAFREAARISCCYYTFARRKQAVAAGRWPEICRLRAMEVCEKKTGLVLAFEHNMRITDRSLSSRGVFVGSYTRKVMEHPTLGKIPQLPYDEHAEEIVDERNDDHIEIIDLT